MAGADSVLTDSLPKKRSAGADVEAIVTYNATDSVAFSIDGGMVELFGQASIVYEDINLKADYVCYEMSNNIVSASGLPDSTGKIVNTPEFADETNSFKSKSLRYNFKTKKGYIEEVITEQEGGYLHASVTKRHANSHIHLRDGIYTTCDAEHPHFGIVITKGISMPGDKIVSGPAYLVIEDVPLPIGIPFGFFPNSRTKTSGILIPQYGEEQRRGFYLRDGGYYFAMNDYLDLRITGDIYTNGTWGVRVGSNYRLNYRFNGSLRLQYFNNIQGYKNIEGLYSVTKDYSVNWSHSQDPKANPTSSFRANVNLSSTSYDQNHTRNINNVMTNTKQSSISYTKSWPNSPFNFSASLNHSQNSNTKSVNLTMPKVSFNMARITPFKRKKASGPRRWYEDVQLSYSSILENRINTYDSLLFTSSVFDDMKNGYKHDIPLSLNIKPFNRTAVLQTFAITPNVRYTGMVYTAMTEKRITGYKERLVNGNTVYDPIINDTILRKLSYAHAFLPSISTGISPKIYGMFQFKGNGRIEAIRHMMTPSASFSYVPDMSSVQADYYRELFDEVNGDTVAVYSIYEDQIYGTPTFNGASGSLNLSLKNNLEAKVRSLNDTVDKVEKVKLLDNFNFSTSYNFFHKDTLTPAWRPISFNGNTRIFKDKINVTFRGTMDPFGYTESRSRTRETYFSQAGRPVRLTNAGISMGITLKSKQEKAKEDGETVRKESMLNDPENTYDGSMQAYDPAEDDYYGGYVDFNVPWSLRLDYDFSYNKPRDESTIVQTIRASGDFSLTPKWKIGFNTGYDIDRKEFTTTNLSIYRDLHCWEMRISVVPFGNYKSYNFQINARSSILSDLKYNKRKSWQDNF
ncbi:MAG: LPS-assembly protein LptD [Bacteroidales bacterium]|nr:LPS-assembly protein LptD [Bacteroidales bacterium]MBN2697416.1 LPS-assembly protein LptD [Bacteroidales bacterium]